MRKPHRHWAVVPPAALPVREQWAALTAPSPQPPRFKPAMIASLPEPARRWLTHAISPGTPLWDTVMLHMHGQIRLGRWRAFIADEALSLPRGYIWAARAGVFGLPVVGYDRLTDGTADMRWRVLNRIPVVAASGDDVARSAAGRLAGEFVLAPTTFAHAAWGSGSDADSATARWTIDGRSHDVEIRVDKIGRLTSVRMQRWGNPGGGEYHPHTFEVTLDDEQNFEGVAITTRFRAAWRTGSDHGSASEFFRAEITGVRFR